MRESAAIVLVLGALAFLVWLSDYGTPKGRHYEATGAAAAIVCRIGGPSFCPKPA